MGKINFKGIEDGDIVYIELKQPEDLPGCTKDGLTYGYDKKTMDVMFDKGMDYRVYHVFSDSKIGIYIKRYYTVPYSTPRELSQLVFLHSDDIETLLPIDKKRNNILTLAENGLLFHGVFIGENDAIELFKDLGGWLAGRKSLEAIHASSRRGKGEKRKSN